MYKYILEQAGDINWMAVFALCTFFFIFITAVIMIWRRTDEHIRHMSHLPLENEPLQNDQKFEL